MSEDFIRKFVEELGTDRQPGSVVTNGWTYHPIPFDGYEDIPCHRRGTTEKRWQIIDNLVGEWKDKLVLDYGCSTGYFTFQAAKKGATVCGVERDLAAAKVAFACLDRFAQEYNMHVVFKKYYDESLQNQDWHVVFALAILNWVGKENAEKFLKTLGNVGCMFLEMPLAGDGMRGADWLKTDQDTIAWVKKHSKFDRVQAIGETQGPGGKARTLFICLTSKETPATST